MMNFYKRIYPLIILLRNRIATTTHYVAIAIYSAGLMAESIIQSLIKGGVLN